MGAHLTLYESRGGLLAITEIPPLSIIEIPHFLGANTRCRVGPLSMLLIVKILAALERSPAPYVGCENVGGALLEAISRVLLVVVS